MKFVLMPVILAAALVVGCRSAPPSESFSDPEFDQLLDEIAEKDAELDQKILEAEAELKKLEQKYGVE